jgi:hypothetical protein
MQTVAQNVVRRFLAKALLADDGFRPPRSVVNGVDEGKLDPHVLLFWKDCVDKISQSPRGWKGPQSYGAAVAYWRNKCAKNGYPLPTEYLEGLGGEGSAGRWSIKPGDEIEEWVKQTMVSQGLIATLEKTAAEWEMEIAHLERLLGEANTRVQKHTSALSKAKTQKGVAQKQKWLEEASKDVEKFSKEMDKARASVKALSETSAKKEKVSNYAIEFEKEFQFLMLVAQKDLSQKTVLESVKKAIERFEAGLEIPDAESPAHDVGRYEGPSGKTAGVLDFISGILAKAWEHLKGAFDFFRAWNMSINDDTKELYRVMHDAGLS